MFKLNNFHFFTILLPALFLIVLILNVLDIEIDLNFKNSSFLFIAGSIPLSLLLGGIISIFGYWIEAIIDKVFKIKHPIVSIIKNYPVTKITIQSVYSDDDLEDENDADKMDNLFDKAKTFFYQRNYSARAKNMTALATFYRNLVPVSLLLIVIIIFSWFDAPLVRNQIYLMYIFLSILIGIFGRYLSQKMYVNWFHEVLKNVESEFKFKEYCNEHNP